MVRGLCCKYERGRYSQALRANHWVRWNPSRQAYVALFPHFTPPHSASAPLPPPSPPPSLPLSLWFYFSFFPSIPWSSCSLVGVRCICLFLLFISGLKGSRDKRQLHFDTFTLTKLVDTLVLNWLQVVTLSTCQISSLEPPHCFFLKNFFHDLCTFADILAH